VAVDALLGTGFAGQPRGAVADAIAALADSRVPVVAADVPSGVDASTGEVCARAVRATATATFTPQSRAMDLARQGARRPGGGDRDRDPP